MRDFTLDDFDAHFGADIDSWGAVSLDDAYICGDDAIFNAETDGLGNFVRRRRVQPAAHIQCGGVFVTRRAFVPKPKACSILAGGSLDYRRGFVRVPVAHIQTGEEFAYDRKRFFFVSSDWITGQEIQISFRGWAWAPEDEKSGIWIEQDKPSGVWVRSLGFSQKTEESLE